MRPILFFVLLIFSFESFAQSHLLKKPKMLLKGDETDEIQEQQEEPVRELPLKEVETGSEISQMTWGEFDPGKGMVIGRNELGTMSISFYMLLRYLNQQPASLSYVDHNHTKRLVDTRNDIELHRMMVWLKGYAYDPRLKYVINFWTVNSTKNIHTIGSLNYEISKWLTFGAGIEGLPGVRSLNGQHPYFLGTDRHLGDEFFKPGFTMGAWLRGKLSKKGYFRMMVGNNLSEVGTTTAQLTRNMATGATVFWYPTTGEFGPRAGYGDYEMHDKLATRTGLSITQSREDRFAQVDDQPNNTQLKLSDGVNLFETGALAPGVTVERANYTIVSADAALKYRGFFADFNYYSRWLNGFKASGGSVPDGSIFDHGFMLQIADQVKPQKLELYTAYSYIWGEFNNPWEIALGANYYPKKTRNWRLNMMINHIEQSPVNSQFGYYVGGQTGETIAIATDVFF